MLGKLARSGAYNDVWERGQTPLSHLCASVRAAELSECIAGDLRHVVVAALTLRLRISSKSASACMQECRLAQRAGILPKYVKGVSYCGLASGGHQGRCVVSAVSMSSHVFLRCTISYHNNIMHPPQRSRQQDGLPLPLIPPYELCAGLL